MHFREAVLALLFSIGFALPARASLIAYEPFDYPVGSFDGANGGIGFANSWSTGADITIQSGNLSSVGYSSVGNKAHLVTSATGGAQRTLASGFGATGTDLWLSFMTKPESSAAYASLAIGSLHFGILGNTSGTGPPSSTWGMDLQGGTGQVLSQVPILYGQTRRLVAHLTFLSGNDRIDLYVNPTTSTPPTAADATKTDVDFNTMPFITTVTLVASASDVQFDDLRFGTNYADVSPVPEPTGLALGIGAFAAVGVSVWFVQTSGASIRTKWPLKRGVRRDRLIRLPANRIFRYSIGSRSRSCGGG